MLNGEEISLLNIEKISFVIDENIRNEKIAILTNKKISFLNQTNIGF